MLSPLPVECLNRAADLDLDVATSAVALPDAFGSQLAGSNLKTSLSYNHHHHHQNHHQNCHQNYLQNHHPHGDLMPAHAVPPLSPSGGPCLGHGQQKGSSLYPRALSAVEPRGRLDYWVAATGKGQGHGQGHKGMAQARGVAGAHSGVPSVVGRCASARHRLARESDVEAHMRAEPCVVSSLPLPCAGLEHRSPATPPPLQSMPSTPARQAEGHTQAQTQAQAQGHSQAQAFSIPVGVPTRRQQGSVPFTQSLSPPAANPRRSLGDRPSPSEEGTGAHCQARCAAGVPCETGHPSLRTLLAHSLSGCSDPENYYAGGAAAPGTPPVRDSSAAGPEAAGVHTATPGVGCARVPGGYTRQGEAQARGKDLLGKSDSGYQYLSYSSNSSYGRSGLAPGGGTAGVPGAYKQSHMGVPSVGSLQRAMLPPVATSEGASPLPMAGRGAQECDLRTQSARLGGLRFRDFDPQAHRGASPLERYNSLQDEGVAVHRGQRFHEGRPHLSPPPPSTSATPPQQGSVFHWAAKARIHAKTELSRRSSV